MTSRLLAGFVLSITALALMLPSGSEAHFDTGHYTHDDCPASDSDRIDPINFYFSEWGTLERVTDNIGFHIGWDNQSGSPQSFVDHGNCSEMSAQRASDCGTCTRFHIRLHPIHWDDGLGWTTVGDAHHEDWVFDPECNPPLGAGHAVDANGPSGSGFDQGRFELFFWFDGQPGHSGLYVWWGNTQNFQQCDDDYAGSDGATIRMTVHQGSH